MPIWYAANVSGWLCDPRAEYRGARTTFDSGRQTLIAVLMQLASLIAGPMLLVSGFKRLRRAQVGVPDLAKDD